MKRRHSTVLATLACLSSAAWAQVQRTPLSDRIEATFHATDLDKNGTISPQEAAKAGIPARSFAQYDKNKDRHLASDEFQDYYQNLILQTRAERARREAEAEAKRVAEAEAKAKAAKELVEAEKAAAKAKDSGTAKDSEGVAQVDPKSKPAKTDPQTPAGGNPPAPSEGLPAPQNPESGNTPVIEAPPLETPGAAPAGSVTGNSETSKVEAQPGAKPQPEIAPKTDAELAQAEQKARGYVQRVLTKGQLSTQDASSIYQSLGVVNRGPDGTLGLVEWRNALNHSKARITDLIRSGALSAEEGREIYDLFEERARRAVQASLTAGEKPVDPPKVAEAADKQPTKAGKETPIAVPTDKAAGLTRVEAQGAEKVKLAGEAKTTNGKPVEGSSLETPLPGAQRSAPAVSAPVSDSTTEGATVPSTPEQDAKRIQDARAALRTNAARENLRKLEEADRLAKEKEEAARKEALLKRQAEGQGIPSEKGEQAPQITPLNKPSGAGPAVGVRPVPQAGQGVEAKPQTLPPTEPQSKPEVAPAKPVSAKPIGATPKQDAPKVDAPKVAPEKVPAKTPAATKGA